MLIDFTSLKQFNWRRLLPWVAALGLFFWIWRQVPWPEISAVLSSLSISGLLFLALLDAVIVLTLSGRWWFILRGLGYTLNYLRLCGYRLSAFGLSYFTPGPQFGGEPLQVWVLTRYHNLPSGSALASVTVDKLLELMANFTILAWGILVVLRTAVLPASTAGGTVIIALLLWGVPTIILLRLSRQHTPLSTSLRWLSRRRSLQPLFQRYANDWQQLQQTVCESEQEVTAFCRQSGRHLFLAIGITALFWLFWLFEFWFVYALLGVRLTMTELLLVLTAARIAFLLPLPGGLGTLEASQVLAMTVINQPTAVGLSAALIIRARDILLGSLGLWLSSRLLSGRKD